MTQVSLITYYRVALTVGLALALLGSAGCTYEVIPEPFSCDTPPRVRLVSKSDASCGATNGRIQVRAEGGAGSYTFQLAGEAAQTDGTFDNLSAGEYTLLATDPNGCQGELTVSVNNSDGVNLSVLATEASCGATDGRITAEVSGGVAPFRFTLDGGQTQSSGVYDRLAPGEYEVRVEDASGCAITQTVAVTSGVALATIQPIIENNCAVSGCHDGSIAPNFTSEATIRDRASRIQARTSARSMPPPSSGRTLTAAQIEEISCWVTSGAN